MFLCTIVEYQDKLIYRWQFLENVYRVFSKKNSYRMYSELLPGERSAIMFPRDNHIPMCEASLAPGCHLTNPIKFMWYPVTLRVESSSMRKGCIWLQYTVCVNQYFILSQISNWIGCQILVYHCTVYELWVSIHGMQDCRWTQWPPGDVDEILQARFQTDHSE